MQGYDMSEQSNVATPTSCLVPDQTARPVRIQNQQQGMWSSGMLKLAFDAVERGGRVRTIARHYGIPPSSFRDHMYGRTVGRKRGRQGVLTVQEEEELQQYLLEMQDLGYPLTIAQLHLKVAEIVQTRVNPFRDGIPGAG